MHRKRNRRKERGARLEMTPMIDVVFLLLVFFVVTVHPRDVLAKLDVSRPSASTGSDEITLLKIDVGPGGYVVNGRRLPLETIRHRLERLYSTSPRTTLVIASTGKATHSQLVKLLDTCAGIGIQNISLMSL